MGAVRYGKDCEVWGSMQYEGTVRYGGLYEVWGTVRNKKSCKVKAGPRASVRLEERCMLRQEESISSPSETLSLGKTFQTGIQTTSELF